MFVFHGLVSFWRYPDPVPYRLKRIRPNDTDPDLDPDPNHCYKERVISAFVINSFKQSLFLYALQLLLITITNDEKGVKLKIMGRKYSF